MRPCRATCRRTRPRCRPGRGREPAHAAEAQPARWSHRRESMAGSGRGVRLRPGCDPSEEGDTMSVEAMPYQHLGTALATDYFFVRDAFTDEQWEWFIAARRFVDREVLPTINEYWEAAELPWPLMRRLPELNLVGEDIQGYGCPGMSPLARGLVNMELQRGDGSLGTFCAVQAGLAMKS